MLGSRLGVIRLDEVMQVASSMGLAPYKKRKRHQNFLSIM